MSILDKSVVFPEYIEDKSDTIHDAIIIGYDNMKSVLYVVDPSIGNEVQILQFEKYKMA